MSAGLDWEDTIRENGGQVPRRREPQRTARQRVAAWVEFDRRNRPETDDQRQLGISYDGYPVTRADLAFLVGMT